MGRLDVHFMRFKIVSIKFAHDMGYQMRDGNGLS